MKRYCFVSCFFSVLLALGIATMISSPAHAAESPIATCDFSTVPQDPGSGTQEITFNMSHRTMDTVLQGLNVPGDFYFYYPSGGTILGAYNCVPFGHKVASVTDRNAVGELIPSMNGSTMTQSIRQAQCNAMFKPDATAEVELWYYPESGTETLICREAYKVSDVKPTCDVNYEFTGMGNIDDDTLTATVTNVQGQQPWHNAIDIFIDGKSIFVNEVPKIPQAGDPPIREPIPQWARQAKPDGSTTHTITAYVQFYGFSGYECGSKIIDIPLSGQTSVCAGPLADEAQAASPPTCDGFETCPWCEDTTSDGTVSFVDLCDQLGKDTAYAEKCRLCAKKSNESAATGKNTTYIWTAIGCMPSDFTTLINDYVLTYGIGLAGGIAFLRFLYGAFLILTSGGNAETLEEAKQIITSSLVGLLVVIFSVFLLQTIGVDILDLPGFTKQLKCGDLICNGATETCQYVGSNLQCVPK